MTPTRFWAAAALFHVIVLAAVWRSSSAWRDASRCGARPLRWLGTLARDALVLAVFAYAVSLLAPVAFTGLDMPLAFENISEPLVPRPETPEGVDDLARRAREYVETVVRGLQAPAPQA